MDDMAGDIREKKTNIVALYPLSPIQGGFFFQSLYERSSDAYFMQLLLDLKGHLSVDALKLAWSMLLDRHESLRASFMWEDLEEPIQIIHRKLNLAWHEEDWQDLSPDKQDKLLSEYITKDRSQGFNFNQAPLMRFGLFKQSDNQYCLLWSYHHILSDGWSNPIILNEIRTLYDSIVNKKPAQLQNRRPYGDYIAWLSQQDQTSAEDYWQQRLMGMIPTKLATKILKEDDTQACRGYTVLNEEDSQKLLNYATKLGVTPNSILQTLWGFVLSTYTGQSDIVFGVIVSGRQSDLPGIESMVGIFINTLPLRIQFKGQDSIEELIKKTQILMIEMQEKAYTPLWKIQAQQKEAGGGLFDCTYVYQNYPVQQDEGQSGLAINVQKSIEKMEYKFGITLSLQQCLTARVNYSESYFSEDFIAQCIQHYERLILNIIHHPSQKICELTLLSTEDLNRLTIFNETEHEYPKDHYIHELIDAVSKRVPEAVAIIYENTQINYKELNEKSNQLAHYLRNLGVEAEVPVLLAMDRSIEIVIGILGILKAGGVYVPIDVNYPKERLEYMLEDSSAPFIVSRSAELKKIPIHQQIVIDLDEIYHELAEQTRTLPKQSISTQNLAYIIYTSGSTGRPKGVGISHGSLCAYLSWAKTIYGTNDSKPILLHGSLCFDMSITSLFVPLLTGKTIEILREDFSKMLEAQKPKVSYGFVKLTPSHLKLITESSHYQLEDLSHCFIVGGESFTGDHLTNSKLTFYNEYGPTEATVACSLYKVDNTKNYQNIPIGQPIWNTKIYILNKDLNLIPIGLEGEIYIGGQGLARGYINQPGLTAEKFIPDPFLEGGRLYKTGDVGRLLPDGNIEFLGRIDHQLKLRGFRIELAEIEATIETNKKIQQAIVLCREDAPGQKRLVAYLVLKKGEDIQEYSQTACLESLQNLCQNRLPEYMQPNQWVFLDSLPLTANGKVDRKALPIPEGREGIGAYRTPVGWMEEQLAVVWSELLGIEAGRNDDFFRLGGHSLLATQMVSRLRELVKREVPLKAVFEHSVLFELAQYIEQSQLEEGLLPSITRVSRDKAQPLSFAEQRLWFIEQLLPNTELYHNPVRLRITGQLNVPALRTALNALVARHEIFRTLIVNSDGVALQKILPENTGFRLDFNDVKNEEEIAAFVKKPFQFEKEPSCRGLLIKYSDENHVLILVFHHMVIDDWSMGLFFKELNIFYNAELNGKGEDSVLPALAVQYVDYSVWQRTWLQGKILEKQLNYWQRQLHEVSPLELPADYPRPRELSYEGGVVERKVSRDLLEKLQVFANTQGVTLFMCMLASVQSFLSRYCNHKDIVVGIPIANRRSAEIEGVMGFFVNTLVIRNKLCDSTDFTSFTRQVEDTTLLAYEHQDVPFEQLVEYLQVTRELNRNPIFQVMFNLQQKEEGFHLGKCEVSIEESQAQLSRFDLLINVVVAKECLYLRFDYAKDIFKKERIERLAEYYETFLLAVLKDPSKRILEIAILGEAERQMIFRDNKIQQVYSRDNNIHQLFEVQVEKKPFDIAVVFDEQEITYLELNEKANQLAHYLNQKGVGPEQFVIISLERSIDLIVAILGVLKAGGVYIPMDPAYPEARLKFMLEDTGTPLLITQKSLREIFTGYNKILFIDGADFAAIQKGPKSNPDYPISLQQLAYIIYTSGSTGKPKGVMVSHKEVVNFASKNNYLNINEKTITLSFSNYVFDGSIFDIFSTLLNAGKLILTSKHDLLNAEILEKILIRHHVNTAFITTALFAYYSRLREKNPLYHISNLLFGGEKINYKDLKTFIEGNLPHNNIIHVYGPTENIVFSSYCYLSADNIQQAPIGKRLSDKVIYLLDDGLQPVSQGVKGEIYIGGEGLARGYLNSPSLTAEKFIPNPFITEQEVHDGRNLRLYRSGDLARLLPNGDIEFIGRVDDQLKIRGYRIELGEIEAELNSHEEVRQAIVAAIEIENQKHLVAYVVPKRTSVANLSELLKEYLISRLPDYMVPASFVLIDKMPLSTSGKIDKKALPIPDLSIRQESSTFIAPQTVLQERLAVIWSQVLRIDKIGIHDNFFRIGGDSIISIQLVAKARQEGIHFAVKDIFNYPTIAALSLAAYTKEYARSLEPEQGKIQGMIPLTPIQHWFFKQNLSNWHHYNQSCLLRIEKPIESDLLEKSFELLIEQHDCLRCRYRKEKENTWSQYNPVDEDRKSLWQLIDLALVADDELSSRIEKEANTLQRGLNIENGPLIKVGLFNCGKRPARLLIIVHHLVIDGVSWRILLEDLQQIYHSLHEKRALHLTKTHSYKQWSHALVDYAHSVKFKQQLAYWQQVEEAIKPLPIDFPGRTIDKLQKITVSLHETETIDLLQKAPFAYRTQINDLLLTALILALGDWTKEYFVSLSLEGHGREDIIQDIDLSRTVGWFTSIFPVVLTLPNSSDMGQSIKHIKEILRNIPQKGIGYGIAKYLLKDAIAANQTIPSLSFNYLGQWDNTFSKNGIFTFSDEPAGNEIDEKNTSPYLLTINCCVRNGRLEFAWHYSVNHYKEKTIEKVAIRFIQKLKQVIQHCCQESVFGYTPSDFNLIKISQEKLDINFGKIPDIETIYPLSPMQAGFLFQASYDPNSDAYFVQLLLKVTGDLQIDAFQEAWSMLLDRHESLRASFIWEDLEEPLQIIHKKLDFHWQVEDWHRLSKDEQNKLLNEYIVKDRTKGFNFNKAPLMRFGLFRSKAKQHYLLWSYHHILSDGWSTPIKIDEVKTIYESLVNKKPLYLQNRKPYRDYIAWLKFQDQKKAEEYWKEVLKDAIPTKLASKTTIKKDQTQSYGECLFALSEGNSKRLLSFAAGLDVTPNTVLQTLWGILLSVYTRQNDVVFGVTVSGRQLELSGVESMVGIFINTLPLRVKLKGSVSIEKLIKDVQNQMLGMQEHAYIPLWKIQPQQKEGGGGLFDSTYVYQNYPEFKDDINSTGIKIELERGIEKMEYKLGINISYRNNLNARINYQEAYFNADFIEEMIARFESLILHVLNIPTQKIGDLSFLSAPESEKLLLWNNNQHEYPKDKCLHELFEASAEKVPSAIAVLCGESQICYSDLNEKSNQLAHYLHNFGVDTEVPVGLAIEPSIEMMVGILGILKAGGIYLPLDVNYPIERLNYILEDSGAPFIISRSLELKKLSISQQIVINLDEVKKDLEAQPKSLPKQDLFPTNLAYIIYTSGSTGKPKGVGISHRSAVHLALVQQKTFSYHPKTKTLHFASISFDASISEWSCTFAEGSTLVLCNNKDLLEVEKIIDEQKIDQMTIPPSVLKNMSPEIISKHTNQIVVAGEASDKTLIETYLKKGMRVINAYGPTEGTVCSSIGIIETVEDCNHIGRPIWNTKIYILDDYLNPMPIGLMGELYISGVNLARGYLNKPGLTAEKFIPNPFETGSRLYKTGDLGRYCANGEIEFLGRTDHQLKLRGFRIELGEIEGTIESSGKVQQAIVLCQEKIPDQKRLVAFIVLKDRTENSEDLLQALKVLCLRRLPDYMQPNQWVILDALPHTPNGKIDRKALIEREDQIIAKEAKIAKNSIEEALSGIFKELLNATHIGVDDSFFEAGGNSLLAVGLVLNIKKELGVKLRIVDVFENPTISKLSNIISSVNYSELNSKLDNNDNIFIIQADGKQKPLFLIHPGVGLSLPYLPLKQFLLDTPIIGIDDPYFGEERSGFKSLEEMASAYLKIIKKVQNTGPYYIAGWSFGGMVAYEIAHQLENQLEDLDALILVEAANPMLVEGMVFQDEKVKLEFEEKQDRNALLAKEYRPKRVKTHLSLIKAEEAFTELTPESYELIQNSKYGWNNYCENITEYKVQGAHATLFEKEYITQLANILQQIVNKETGIIITS